MFKEALKELDSYKSEEASLFGGICHFDLGEITKAKL